MLLADKASVPTRSSNAKLGRAYLTSCPSKDSLPHELQYTPRRWRFKSPGVRDWTSLGGQIRKDLHVLRNVENYSPNDIQSRTPGDLNQHVLRNVENYSPNDIQSRTPGDLNQQQHRMENHVSHFKRSAQFWFPIQFKRQA
jgi:hypothetical protein